MSIPVVRFVYGGQESTGGGSGRPYTVVWDGSCKVCGRLVALLGKWDRRNAIETIPYQNAGVLARFPWIPAEEYTQAVQLIGPGGQTWQGAAAIDRLLDVLPYGGWLGWVFNLPLVGRQLDRFYRWFARNRYRFGCGEHCQIKQSRLNYGDALE